MSLTVTVPPSAVDAGPPQPGPTGRDRIRPRRVRNPPATRAGTGTSPWPCSPTRSWPLSQPRPLKGEPQKRPHQHHSLHPGRSPPTPGRSAAPPHTPPRTRYTRPELVPLAQTTPSRSPPLPLPKKNQLRQRFLTGVPGHGDERVWRNAGRAWRSWWRTSCVCPVRPGSKVDAALR